MVVLESKELELFEGSAHWYPWVQGLGPPPLPWHSFSLPSVVQEASWAIVFVN